MLIFSSLAGTKKSTCFRPLVTTWSPRRRQWVILSLATWVSEYLHIFVLSRSAMWWILMLAMPIRWVKSSSRISYFLQQPGPYCELWWTGEHCLVAASVVMVYTCALHGVFFWAQPSCHGFRSGNPGWWVVFVAQKHSYQKCLDHSHMLQVLQNSILIIIFKKIEMRKSLRTFDDVLLFYMFFFRFA